MIAPPGWQEATIEELTHLLQPNSSVVALALFGAIIQAGQDAWSDLDVLLVVAEGEMDRFHPGTDWLQPMGELYTCDRSSHAYAAVTRACFLDFRRIDFVITAESALERADEWPSLPFWNGTRLLFSRSLPVEELLGRVYSRAPLRLMTADQFATMADSFWFKGMLAVTKVMRRDLLIALHLALEMVQDCCVLGMALRDRALGTSHHREGGAGNDIVAALEVTRRPHTAAGILETLAHASMVFDELAGQWSSDAEERRQPLLDWIEYVRAQMVREDGRRV